MRVVDRGAEALVLSKPEGWDPQQLETASLRLWDGTLVQVGKSTEAREDLLRASAPRSASSRCRSS